MATDGPELSLVMGTLGRVDELAGFLDALHGQPGERLELIVVDQNRDDRVARLLAGRDDAVAIQHLQVPWCGLSRARNFGAAAAHGELLGFPDDDCHYAPGFVAEILAWFQAHPDADGLSCRVADDRGRRSAGGFMSHGSHWLDRRNVWRSAVSPGIFVRRELHESVAGFDERLGRGAGTPWGSAEDTDYLLRALGEGARIHYAGERIVRHPPTIDRGPRLSRWWSYGRGMGFTLRKNGYPLHTALYFASLSFGAAGWSALRLEPGRAVARTAMGAGRIAGWAQAGRALPAPAPAPVPVRSQAVRSASP